MWASLSLRHTIMLLSLLLFLYSYLLFWSLPLTINPSLSGLFHSPLLCWASLSLLGFPSIRHLLSAAHFCRASSLKSSRPSFFLSLPAHFPFHVSIVITYSDCAPACLCWKWCKQQQQLISHLGRWHRLVHFSLKLLYHGGNITRQ